MKSEMPVVAIIGRGNVGKSTLFNALIGRRKSVIKDESGVTRDRSYATVKTNDFVFTLIDTAGLFSNPRDKKNVLEDRVETQTKLAIEESDLLLVLFDGKAGLHPEDSAIANLVRKARKPVIWIVNKSEKPSTELEAAEFYSLGIEDLVFISAAHRKGLKDLLKIIREKFPESQIGDESGEDEQAEDSSAIRVAVLGKPNVGKSTLINQLLGENRLVTSEIAGTTTDSIDIELSHKGRDYVLIDTAGLRRKARVKDISVERYSNIRSLSALAKSDVAVLLLDATQGEPSDQDLKIAQLIHERGRGLVIAINKWDAIEKNHKTAKAYKDQVYSDFRFARYAPIVFVSALSGKRCKALLDKVSEVYEAAKFRVKTSDLNKVLNQAVSKNSPPAHRGEPVKLYFATQIHTAPPTFVLFFNHPRRIDSAYQRYLKNSLREEFPFTGSDIKLLLRKRSDRSEINAN